MAEQWSDARLEAALAELGDELDTPDPARLDPHTVTARPRRPRRWWLAVAAAVVLVMAGILVIPPARETVARWFGLDIERGGGEPVPTEVFADGVTPLDVDAAITTSALDPARLDASPLGRPDSAGIPPEGGVLLAWDRGTTTLWVRPGENGVDVVKRLSPDQRGEWLGGIGEIAVLIDGTHELVTPSRRIAAGRVLWWVTDAKEFRLESELDAATMLAVGSALSPS